MKFVRTESPSAATKQGLEVVVVTTALLVFISFWRAAAIVLNDLASSAFTLGALPNKPLARQRPGSSSGSCFSHTRCALFISRAAACSFAVAYIGS